ncbi:MAG: hypothetical protein R2725_04790 [Solirubrobacterales bacterium]
MSVEQLVDSLLYEGYALYPYTPGATKNATPTPHGIVYPPAYAVANPAAAAMLRVEVIAEHEEGTAISASVRFLQASGDRHQGMERTLRLGHEPIEEILGADGVGARFELDAAARVCGRARLRAEQLEPGVARVRLCVHNETEAPGGERLDRAAALRRSLISTHVVLRLGAGRFISPVENEGPRAAAVATCENVNTWPVLASPGDDVVLGASMYLPDHPRIAPESLGGLFDNTEIEEALLLHVQTLSEEERQAIGDQDPKVRETIERAERATPEQMLGLHGRLEPGHPQLGEPRVYADGRTFERGDSIVLRPRRGGDPYDAILAGRRARIERIYVDHEEGVHLGITVDDDPGQDLMRESGRYLFFKPEEVETR